MASDAVARPTGRASEGMGQNRLDGANAEIRQ